MIRDYSMARPRGRPEGRGRERLPRVKRLCTFLLVVLLVAAGSAVLWEGYQKFIRLPYFQIADIEVEGNLQVAAQDIIASLGLPKETSILEVDLPALSRRLLQNPWIKGATIRRRLPLSLVVRVVERMPEAVFVADRRYLLSADGVILCALEEDELPMLPTLRAAARRRVAPGEHVLDTEMAQGLAVWRQFQLANALGGEKAHEIAMAGDGSYLVNLGQEMPIIRLRAQDLQEQLRRLGAALLASGKGLQQFADVDLRFRDRVVFRPVARR
jgi:hypothetical protein